MPKSLKQVMGELHDLMDQIVQEGNEVDYVAILDFADNVQGVDIIRATSRYRNPARKLDEANLRETIAIERKSYRVNPYDEDKFINARTHLYRFSPTRVEELVVMFACATHGDTDTFRAECHRHRQGLIDKLRELDEAT